jgi:hypothetical protein
MCCVVLTSAPSTVARPACQISANPLGASEAQRRTGTAAGSRAAHVLLHCDPVTGTLTAASGGLVQHVLELERWLARMALRVAVCDFTCHS